MTNVDTDRQGLQSDSLDGAAADEQTAPDADDQDDDAQSDDAQDDDAQDAGGRGAAKQRRRAQKAERRVAELEALLDSTRRQAIGEAVKKHGYKPGLIEKVATEDMLNDKGMPDAEKIKAAMATAADDVGATPRRTPVPNPQQGAVGGQGRSAASWSSALKGR